MIQFGTDGWRAEIADTFTFENVQIVTQAYANVLMAKEKDAAVAIGYDNRFGSERFADTVAKQLARNDIRVRLATQPCPTPAISYTVKQEGLAGAVMITASHNPASFNGFKVKADYAGSAPPELTQAIEQELKAAAKAVASAPPLALDPPSNKVTSFDPLPPYLEQLKALVNLETIAKSKLRVFVDPMYGSGIGILPKLLRPLGVPIEEIHHHRDPLFGGVAPEPVAKNLNDFSQLLKGKAGNGPAFGIVLDGDADRVGAMGSDGEFITPHEVFLMLLHHLHEHRNMTGGVAKACNISSTVDQLAKHFGLKVWETAIGFKYVCDLILTQDILIGGEESGGYGIKGHIPERDGPLCGLLLLEALATENMSAEAYLKKIWQHSGRAYYQREDFRILSLEKKAAIMAQFEQDPPKTLNGEPVVDVKRIDGIKLITASGNWMLVRPSGTEPLIRLYVEAVTRETQQAILREAKTLIN